MYRRTLLTTAARACAALSLPGWATPASAAEPGVTTDTLSIGNSMGLTGILAASAASHVAGIQAAFKAVNESGGISGRMLRLVSKDDGYVPARTADNVKAMLETHEVLAFVSVQGTGNNAAALPYIERHGAPLVGPITGAGSLRKPQIRNIFHVKAGYNDEATRLIEQLAQMGLSNVAIVYLDNAYGKEVLQDLEAAVKARKLQYAGNFKLANDGSNGSNVAQTVADAKPSVVVLAITGTATTSFVTPFRKLMPGLPLVGNSVTFLPAEIKKMGTAIHGSALTMVMPDSRTDRLAVSRAFKNSMRAAGSEKDINSSGLESWVNAQVLIEGLRRCGRDITRPKLHAALSGLRRDLGEFMIGFGVEAPYVASQYVRLGVMSADGTVRS